MAATVRELTIPKPVRRARVPLRVGDTWVLLGPRTEFVITALAPRPTEQKPDAQAVTLDDGRTLAESTLRTCYQRKAEQEASIAKLGAKLREMFHDHPWFRDRISNTVVAFPAGGRNGQR